MEQKWHQQCCVYFFISEYLSFHRQIHACGQWNEIFIDRFSQFSNHYISYLQSEHKYELSISNKMWQHVFRSGSQIIYFHSLFFSYVPDYILYLLVHGNYPLTLKTWGCSNLLQVDSWLNRIDLTTIESNRPKHKYYFPPDA